MCLYDERFFGIKGYKHVEIDSLFELFATINIVARLFETLNARFTRSYHFDT